MKKALLFTLLALAFAGCSTVEYSEENGRLMCHVGNTSWKLLGFLPLGGGDPETPNENLCCWFRDTTTLKNNMTLLGLAVEKKQPREVKDVVTYRTDIFYTLFLRRKSIHTSAELVK